MNIETHGRLVTALAAVLVLANCQNADNNGNGQRGEGATEAPGQRVATTGKKDTALAAVPPEVLLAARKARPDLQIAASEYEVRDGREYYDLAGTQPDGAELELDMTRVDGDWTVVEVQRDVTLQQVADGARQALEAAKPDWTPRRIIESDQGEGIIIYEFFGPGPGDDQTKIEVKWANGAAEVLRDEWLH